MVLDRRMAHRIGQALDRARNRRGESDILEYVAQNNAATDDKAAG